MEVALRPRGTQQRLDIFGAAGALEQQIVAEITGLLTLFVDGAQIVPVERGQRLVEFASGAQNLGLLEQHRQRIGIDGFGFEHALQRQVELVLILVSGGKAKRLVNGLALPGAATCWSAPRPSAAGAR